MRALRRIRRFLLEDIWRVDLTRRSRVTRVLVLLLRTLVLAYRGADRNRSSVWAASLTYISLMSVIPFIALVAGIGSRLGVPGKALESLTGQMPDEQIRILRGAVEAFEKADLKALGIVAFIVLLWAMVKALTSVEKALNEIWSAERGRSFVRRLSNYVSVAVLGPLFILAGMALTAAVMSSSFMARVSAIPLAGPAARFAFAAGPFLTAWFGLALLYCLLPNARVRFSSATVGAVVAGVLWQVVQRLYFGAQKEVASLGMAYGAFAAIPMFLAWMYVSWLIVLLGAEICHGLQHAASFAYDRGLLDPSQAALEKAGLRVAVLLARRFTAGSEALDADGVAQELRLSDRLAMKLLRTLAAAGILASLEDGRYQPARPPATITAAEVVKVLRNQGAALELPRAAGAEDALDELTRRSLAALDVPLTEL